MNKADSTARIVAEEGASTPTTFTTSDGLKLRGDEWGDPADPPIVFAHGGGQTRHAWGKAAAVMAGEGWHTFTYDARAHGDSDWSDELHYSAEWFAQDQREIAKQVGGRPVLVGASLGGISAMMAQGESEQQIFEAIVLVDITPTTDEDGVRRIRAFMTDRLHEGFATMEEAADAIAAYLPHRPRPKDMSGLSKNLRLRNDGRYRWHWDPRYIEVAMQWRDRNPQRLEKAARNLRVPTLLVRGGASEIVREENVRAFREMVPHAEYADVSEAGHMVAGDRNDAFNDAVIDFLRRLRTR
jgi:pimeloyl-ACP methyl ester carboxylesterase